MDVGKRILAARKSAKMTLQDLGKALDLSQTAISKYEKGQIAPNSTMLLKLAKALGVKVEFFFRDSEVNLEKIAYRKKSALTKSEEESIEAKAKEWMERYYEVEQLFPSEEKLLDSILGNFDRKIEDLDDVEVVAKKIREQLDIGFDSIENMVDLLEDIGINVAFISADIHFDAISYKNQNGGYVIVANSNFKWARSRFTLAHELGHIVLQVGDDIDQEKAANRFAGAFLIPKKAALKELGEKRSRLHATELVDLKRKYGVSMQAWVYRASDIGIITEWTKRNQMIEFRTKNWHRNEPDEINRSCPHEQPKRLERLVGKALAEDIISLSRAEELTGKAFPNYSGEVI